LGGGARAFGREGKSAEDQVLTEGAKRGMPNKGGGLKRRPLPRKRTD